MKIRQLFTEVEDVHLLIKGLKKGDDVAKNLPSGILVVNGVEFHFTVIIDNFFVDRDVLKVGIIGSLKINIPELRYQTSKKHARRDYVVILLGFLHRSMKVYLKKEQLDDFFRAVTTGDVPKV